MAAGFAAGVTEALVVVTPFEVVKIRLQQQKGLTKELLKYKVHTEFSVNRMSSSAAEKVMLVHLGQD